MSELLAVNRYSTGIGYLVLFYLCLCDWRDAQQVSAILGEMKIKKMLSIINRYLQIGRKEERFAQHEPNNPVQNEYNLITRY